MSKVISKRRKIYERKPALEINQKNKNRKKHLRRHIRRNGLVEVRILGVEGQCSLWHGNATGIIVGYFDDADKLNEVVDMLRQEKIQYENAFMSLHKPRKSFQPGTPLNTLIKSKKVKGKLLYDKAIAFYSYIFIDVDANCKRKPAPTKIMKECLSVRDDIKTKLMSFGFLEPITVATGNGGCLFFSVKGFKNEELTRRLIQNFLKSLANEFDSDTVKIDTKVFNPARLCRVPGTYNRKGEERENQGFRMARIDDFPDKLKLLQFKTFEKIIKRHFIHSEKEALTQIGGKKKQSKTTLVPIFDVGKYLKHHGIEVLKEKMVGGAKCFCLQECVFDSSHSPNDAAIVQQSGGKLSYQCFHDSCQDKTWKGARHKISGKDSLKEFKVGKSWRSTSAAEDYEDLTLVNANDVMKFISTLDPVIQSMLGEGEATIIAGPGGVGKSFLTLFMAMFVTNAKENSQLFNEFKVRKPYSTLIIQAENSIHNIQPRLKLMLKQNPHFKKNNSKIKFVGRDGGCRISGCVSDPKFQSALIKMIIQAKVKIIIIDPLISFVNESENDNTGMRKELDAIRSIMDQTGVSAIIVHHSGKNFGGGGSSLRGASAIADWADNVIGLSKHQSGDGNEYLMLKSEKSRNSVNFKPLRVKFTGLKFERTAIVGEDKSNIVVAALKSLGGSVKTQTELADKVVELTEKGSPSTAKRFIKKASKDGLIEVVPSGGSTGYMIPKDTHKKDTHSDGPNTSV